MQRVYRMTSEDLHCPKTESKALAGGRRVHVIVTNSYNGDVVLAD